MLSEVAKIKPSVLIMWKTERLGRDRYTLIIAKKIIKDAGCRIKLIAEVSPDDSPESGLMEGIMESMAEFHSKQLAQNITRGMKYNAENALYNGHNMLGCRKGADKKYVIDPNTSPIVKRIFEDYASGKPMQHIANELNEQGPKTVLGKNFTVNGLRSILHNESYTGVYKHSGIDVPDGIPVLISKELFDNVQKRFLQNKRTGSQRANGLNEDDSPRYWLTGKLVCNECNGMMHGVLGTSKTGKKYYYYSNQRKKVVHAIGNQ